MTVRREGSEEGVVRVMRVEILGEAGPKLERLRELAAQVALELGLEVEIVSIHDLAEIVKKGVAWTPALIVNGSVKCSGRIPSLPEVRAYLS